MRLAALLIAALGAIRAAADDAAVRIAVEGNDPTRVVASCAPNETPPSPIDEATGRRFLTLTLADAVTGEAGPPIFGTYAVESGRLTFRPRFGLVRGATYRARTSAGGEIEYRVPMPPAAEPTVVAAIYPGGERLPANLLKFYLVFSRPMREGREVLDRIELIDGRGSQVDGPWRDLEVWNSDATRLTLFIHPGRIKQGVNLREQLGPVLRPGEQYELVVPAELRDARGVPLGREFRKSFTTSDELHAKIDVARWRLTTPAAGSREPLTIEFDRPLDRFLAARCLRVGNASGNEVVGDAIIKDAERRWTFTPAEAWRGERYAVDVDDVLEDQAGNTATRVFDNDLKAAAVEVLPPVMQRTFDPR